MSAYALDLSIVRYPYGQTKYHHPVLLVKIVRDGTTAGIGGEELRLKLSYKSTRLRPYRGWPASARLFEGGGALGAGVDAPPLLSAGN
jgi:hypothetical protein